VSDLKVRKELLIAESEINRRELLKDWAEIQAGSRTLVRGLKLISSIGTAAAFLGKVAFRPERAVKEKKRSIFKTALTAAKFAGSLWLALRRRRE